jgi:hypothetical protein
VSAHASAGPGQRPNGARRRGLRRLTRPRANALAGREGECASLDRLLAAAHQQQSAVLVLRGEAGIGKSALLDYAAERAEGCVVCRAVGAEWEMELPFAGLHQLCVGLLDARDDLPAPQRDALEIAFGLSSGTQPDRFLVSLAVLSLLSGAAAWDVRIDRHDRLAPLSNSGRPRQLRRETAHVPHTKPAQAALRRGT